MIFSCFICWGMWLFQTFGIFAYVQVFYCGNILCLLWIFLKRILPLTVLPNRSTFSGSASLIVVSLYHATIHSWDSLDLRLASPEFMCVCKRVCRGNSPSRLWWAGWSKAPGWDLQDVSHLHDAPVFVVFPRAATLSCQSYDWENMTHEVLVALWSLLFNCTGNMALSCLVIIYPWDNLSAKGHFHTMEQHY